MTQVIDTTQFYEQSCEKGFVKLQAIARNKAWVTPTEWGDLQITINLSKPEKDPRAIAAAAKSNAQQQYVDPATGSVRPCPLCVTEHDVQIGYARRITLGGEPWGLWYSPYAYYNEHCIAMSWQHRPMHIDRLAFQNLLEFLQHFPHYFIGSNADLPIVGGSILGHDHFQGGRHVFPMQQAPVTQEFTLAAFPAVQAGILKWPLTVIRLQAEQPADIVEAACHILNAWRSYSDESVGVVACTGDVPHNTITPIARMSGNSYQMDLALRCNVTSSDYPLGVFHPHPELHHIKKENIGLIEVMGLAILPPRVQDVMQQRGLSCDDVGRAFGEVLQHAGVFKWDTAGRAALNRFLDTL